MLALYTQYITKLCVKDHRHITWVRFEPTTFAILEQRLTNNEDIEFEIVFTFKKLFSETSLAKQEIWKPKNDRREKTRLRKPKMMRNSWSGEKGKYVISNLTSIVMCKSVNMLRTKH